MKLKSTLPRLYPILDVSSLASRDTATVLNFAEELAAAGCTLIQYRNKLGSPPEILSQGRELKRVLGTKVTLIMNDRADLALAAGFDGVHVGQDDLSPNAVRALLGPDLLLGVSTHNREQLAQANATSADYLAIGPIFSTASKLNPDATVGLDGLRAARLLTRKPLVAIGGITRATAAEVLSAGADSIAVIADLLASPRESAEAFLNGLQ